MDLLTADGGPTSTRSTGTAVRHRTPRRPPDRPIDQLGTRAPATSHRRCRSACSVRAPAAPRPWSRPPRGRTSCARSCPAAAGRTWPGPHSHRSTCTDTADRRRATTRWWSTSTSGPAACSTGPTELRVVPGASHLFEEPGTLEEVATQAADWFTEHRCAELRLSSSRTRRPRVPRRAMGPASPRRRCALPEPGLLQHPPGAGVDGHRRRDQPVDAEVRERRSAPAARACGREAPAPHRAAQPVAQLDAAVEADARRGPQ